MKKVTVLILTFTCCLGSAICCELQCLTSMAQKLGAVEEKIKNMGEKMTLLEEKLLNTQNEVLELRSLTGGKSQVAFSAALRESGNGDIGPFNTNVPLQYKKIFSNAGNSYNLSTGIFSAPIKGMYFFRFSMFNNLNQTPSSVVSLKKNGVRLVSVWDTSGTDANDMGSNAVVIPLDVGDNVYVELVAQRVVYDDSMNYNTFSGFLLYAM